MEMGSLPKSDDVDEASVKYFTEPSLHLQRLLTHETFINYLFFSWVNSTMSFFFERFQNASTLILSALRDAV